MITIVPPKSPAVAAGAERVLPPSPVRQVARKRPALRALFLFYFWPHALLAVCLAGIVGLLVAIAEVRGHVVPPRGYEPATSVLLVSWAQVLMMIGCPIAGVCIGVFHARPDADEKMWSLLIHRPASSRVLFVGRVLAGLALYGVAVGVPMAIYFGYAFFQRGVPYHWTFMLPGFADFLTGVVYYLAGSLAVVRMARIYGSRLLPLAGAVACSALVVWVPRFYEAMAVVGIFLVVYGVALHGAHATKGYRLKGAAVGRVATGMTLFAGLALMGVVPAYWAQYRAEQTAEERQGEVWSRAETQTPEWRSLNKVENVTRYFPLPDGSLGKSIYTPPSPEVSTNSDFDEYPYQTFFRVGPPEAEVRPTREELTEVSRHTGYMNTIAAQASYRALGAQEGRIPDPLPRLSSARDSTTLSDETSVAVRNSVEKWWYLQPSGVIQGFELPSGKLIGSLGANGFHSGRFGVTGFGRSFYYDSDEWIPTDFLTPDGDYFVNLAQRIVTSSWTFPPGEKIIATCNAGGSAERFAIAADKMFVYAGTSSPRMVPLTHSAASNYLKITRFAEQHRWVISYHTRENGITGGSFAYYDDNWTLLSEIEVPSLFITVRGPGYPPAWMTASRENIVADFAKSLGSVDALCCLPVVYPVKKLAGNAPVRVFVDDGISETDSFEVLQSHEAAYWRSAGWALLATLLAMIPVAIGFRVRFKGLWVLSAAVFGPIMVLVLICTHAWPARAKCPACGRMRWLGGPRCARCSMPFGQPARNGTEILSELPGGAA